MREKEGKREREKEGKKEREKGKEKGRGRGREREKGRKEFFVIFWWLWVPNHLSYKKLSGKYSFKYICTISLLLQGALIFDLLSSLENSVKINTRVQYETFPVDAVE